MNTEEKTAMQQFYDSLDMEVQLGFCKDDYAKRLKWYIETYHLPKEKEQLLKSYDIGKHSAGNSLTGEQYYNQTFTNKN